MNKTQKIITKILLVITIILLLIKGFFTFYVDILLFGLITYDNLTREELVPSALHKKISVIAEDIKNPEDYIFEADLSPEMIKIGFPVKLDLKPFTNLEVGDILELSFGGKTISAEVYDFKLKEDNDSKYYNIKSYINPDIKETNHNSIWISLHYFDEGENFEHISLDKNFEEYEFILRDNLGYYYEVHKLDEEYRKQEHPE